MTSEPYAPPVAPLGSPSPPPAKPRRWWIAGLLALIAAGLGQVYVGKAAKGIAGFFFALILVLACSALLVWGPSPRFALALFLLPIGLYVYLWIDAVLAARRLGAGYRLKRYNRWYVYLAYIVMAQVLAPQLVGIWRANFAQTFYIPAGSMEPTLLIGDRLYVDNRHFRSHDPERGDLVVFSFPEKPDVLAVKRVVGIPGDRLEIRNKELFINGQRQSEPYVIHSDRITYDESSPTAQGRQRDQASAVVPPGEYFLLGDNRDHSYDSRFFGPVSRESIKGGGRMVIYWSRNPETGEVYWDRIGRIID